MKHHQTCLSSGDEVGSRSIGEPLAKKVTRDVTHAQFYAEISTGALWKHLETARDGLLMNQESLPQNFRSRSSRSSKARVEPSDRSQKSDAE